VLPSETLSTPSAKEALDLDSLPFADVPGDFTVYVIELVDFVDFAVRALK
jgi:hypothetical protein